MCTLKVAFEEVLVKSNGNLGHYEFSEETQGANSPNFAPMSYVFPSQLWIFKMLAVLARYVILVDCLLFKIPASAFAFGSRSFKF